MTSYFPNYIDNFKGFGYYDGVTTVDRINKNVQQLPAAIQQEVLDFVDFLIHKGKLRKNGLKADNTLQKAASIELWAKSQPTATPVILDDRREIIYED